MLSPGVQLGGRYRLDERIASGGMGDVWRGTDEVLGRTVAVKVLLPALLEEPGFAERFRGEARTMATINHPGVVDVYDYGSDQAGRLPGHGVRRGRRAVRARWPGSAGSPRPGPWRWSPRPPTRCTPRTRRASCTATSSRATCWSGRTARWCSPTSASPARRWSAQLTAAGSVLGTASYISPEQATGGSRHARLRRLRARRGRLPVPGRAPAVRGRQPARDRDEARPGDAAAAARRHPAARSGRSSSGRWPRTRPPGGPAPPRWPRWPGRPRLAEHVRAAAGRPARRGGRRVRPRHRPPRSAASGQASGGAARSAVPAGAPGRGSPASPAGRPPAGRPGRRSPAGPPVAAPGTGRRERGRTPRRALRAGRRPAARPDRRPPASRDPVATRCRRSGKSCWHLHAGRSGVVPTTWLIAGVPATHRRARDRRRAQRCRGSAPRWSTEPSGRRTVRREYELQRPDGGETTTSEGRRTR